MLKNERSIKRMLQKTISVDISLTSREIEYELWNMDAVQRVDLILAMAQRFKTQPHLTLMQLQEISDEINREHLLTDEERQDAIHLFETIAEYLKGET